MPLIANLTLAQLRAATKAQIITAIANYLTNNFTKRQLIAFLLDVDVVSDTPVRTYRTDGQIETENIDTHDAETDALVASRQARWFYYPTGEVDTITIAEGATVRTIKHYLDGQQPTVTVQSPAKVAAEAAASPARRSLHWLKLAALALVVIALAALAIYLGTHPWLTH